MSETTAYWPKLPTLKVAVLNDSFSNGSGIYFFNAVGLCTYYEEMGGGMHSIWHLHAVGQDHLVLVFQDSKVLCSP
jgi:hypothetical protein